MPTEPIVVDVDPDDDGSHRARPVVVNIEVPPKGQSKGWGDMSWTRRC